jgi:putative protease
MEKRVELLAPAGSYEALQAAIKAGADAIYFGVEQLNMRARATMNFKVEDLPQITKRLHKQKVKAYLTLNTIIYDHDIPLMKRILEKAKEAEVDGIIAMDQAVIMAAHAMGLPVHISTQANISNIEAVKFYATYADVMVLARELTLSQIKNIVKQIEKQDIRGPSGELVKIEVFAHGALCMAISGKCYLSLHSHNASANRGACVQNCRRAYEVTDLQDGIKLRIENEYIMSPKDLCTIDFLDALLETGISVLKIEGRARGADYVYTTVKCYREAIDAYYEGTYTREKVEAWMERLRSVYNRGFWEGYYLGRKLGEWSDGPGSQATRKKLFLGEVQKYYPKLQVAQFLMRTHSLKEGETLLIIGPKTGVLEIPAKEMWIENQVCREVHKGDVFTMQVPVRVRPMDKFYKLVPN